MIDNRPILKALRNVKGKKLMKEVHRLDNVLPSVEIKVITELTDTILTCALVVIEEFNRAKLNGNLRVNQQPG